MRATLGFIAVLSSVGPTMAHDWYSGLKSPAGERCCNEQDCEPVGHRYNRATGRLELDIQGVWVPIDTAKLVPALSPDGLAHACFDHHWMLKRSPVVRCIILPGDS